MKKLTLCALLVASSTIHNLKAQGKEFKEIITKELSYENVDNNMLEVQNLNGSITVEGYDGSVVLLEVEKTVSATTTENLELGKKEIGVKVIQQGDRLIIYPDVPNMHYTDGRFTNVDCKGWTERPYEHT